MDDERERRERGREPDAEQRERDRRAPTPARDRQRAARERAVALARDRRGRRRRRARRSRGSPPRRPRSSTRTPRARRATCAGRRACAGVSASGTNSSRFFAHWWGRRARHSAEPVRSIVPRATRHARASTPTRRSCPKTAHRGAPPCYKPRIVHLDPGDLLPRAAHARRALRRPLLHRRAHDRHLLPADLSRAHAAPRELLVRAVRGRGRGGRLPAVPALPPRERAGHARRGSARRRRSRAALRLIADGALDAGGVGDLAARLGIGERQLRRLFAQHLGAGPLAIARTRRAHFAARAARADGLARVARRARGRLHEPAAIQRGDPRHVPPRAARAARRSRSEPKASEASGGPPHRSRAAAIRLPYRAPFDAAGLFAYLARARGARRGGVGGGACAARCASRAARWWSR